MALLQASSLGPEWMLAPLFGNLTREEQDRAIAPAPAGRRKIVLATNIANSAFHGTRLNVRHVSQIMERLLQTAENRFGIARAQIAAETMFVSHESTKMNLPVHAT